MGQRNCVCFRVSLDHNQFAGSFLLPSSKFSWLAIAVALLLTALLLFVVVGIRDPATSSTLSNILQTAILLWAASCSLPVARRSSGYLRQLWILFAAMLFLVSAAQALETYYQSYVHAPIFNPWPSDILFIIWATPAVMMLLPRPAEQSGTIDWQQVLDFAQIGVVALTAYLYFFYIPSRWEVEGPQMVVKMLRVQMLRDLALAVGFAIRAGTISSRSIRAFFARMAIFFLLAGSSGLVFVLGMRIYGGRATWPHVIWCVPFLFASAFAATWNLDEEPILREARPAFRVVAFSQALPLLIPLLVLFMGRGIAAEQITIAWIAITASFILSASRLVLTSEKQRRIADNLRRAEQALRHSEHMFFTAFRSSPDAVGISSIPGGQFLEVNDSFARLTGYAREETLGRTPLELNLWKDPEQRAKIMAKLQEQLEVREEEFQCVMKSGEIRICQFSGTLIDLDGQLGALIQFANQAAQQLFGITTDQAKGKDSSQLDLISFREDGTEIPFSMRPGPRAIATRRTIQNEVTGWRRRDSSEVFWTLGNAVPQFAPDGSVSAVINAFTNITERKQAEEALHQLSTRLLQLQDEERRRLGRELHDSLAQSVLAVNLNLAQAAQTSSSLSERGRNFLAEARRLLQEMSREIRTLSYLLHPPLLDELGLVSAIKEYAEGFSDRSGVELGLDLQTGFGRLSQEAETALFRIVQESLTNIQRHSGSPTATIRLRGDSACVTLDVADRGRGMDKNVIERGKGSGTRLGVGILGMRERMTQLGGTLEIASNSSGTTVHVSIPLRAEASHAGSNPHS